MEDIKADEKRSAKRVMIKDLSNEEIGNNVQVIGHIKEIIDQSSFLLTDTTGELTVEMESGATPFKVNDLINVYALAKPTMEGEIKLEGLFIQDMKGLNFENYKKIYDLKKGLI